MQTAFLGDLLLAIPLFKRLRQLKPNSPIICVCRKGVGDILFQLGVIDQYLEINKGSNDSYEVLQKSLKAIHFEWIVCPHESFRSALFCFKLNANVKIGFKKWWNFFVFDSMPLRDIAFPESIRQLSILREQDSDLDLLLKKIKAGRSLNKPIDGCNLTNLPEWAKLQVLEKVKKWPMPLALEERFVCIFPGSVWNTKKWIETGFRDVGIALSRQGIQIVWMGAKDEEIVCQKLESQVEGSISLAGRTSLAQSLVILSRALAVLSNDSGGQHLAAVVDVPTVTIFGPTILQLGYRPCSTRSAIVQNATLKCRPCGKHGHEKCPLGTHECMQSISPSQVMEVLSQYIPN